MVLSNANEEISPTEDGLLHGLCISLLGHAPVIRERGEWPSPHVHMWVVCGL